MNLAVQMFLWFMGGGIVFIAGILALAMWPSPPPKGSDPDEGSF